MYEVREGIKIQAQKLSWHQKVLLSKEIKMKCRSFQENGYQGVNENELLDYLLLYRWKNRQRLSIKECKRDILHIEPNDFFDYQQLVAQTSPFQLNDWTDIKDLL
nr:post-transcriptional regulator [Enterococcus sp. BWR-S5]